ncbi:MAG: GAF domain-containing protein [Elusimicrobia bacterium]|nr:GAF domain-containing protein [Elusimicrobiota bacterium]
MANEKERELTNEMQEIKDANAMRSRPSRARYDKAHANLEKRWRRRELKSERMMREIVDELWDTFAQSPYSWCGFYVLPPGGQELILGAHREKPACSPLPLSGVCGKALKEGKTIIVPDVKALGDQHIECDPKNQSEIAVPVYDKDGKVWAVFDADSEAKSAFDEMDQRWLETIMRNFEKVGKPE